MRKCCIRDIKNVHYVPGPFDWSSAPDTGTHYNSHPVPHTSIADNGRVHMGALRQPTPPLCHAVPATTGVNYRLGWCPVMSLHKHLASNVVWFPCCCRRCPGGPALQHHASTAGVRHTTQVDTGNRITTQIDNVSQN
jgi:hypothetical protein